MVFVGIVAVLGVIAGWKLLINRGRRSVAKAKKAGRNESMTVWVCMAVAYAVIFGVILGGAGLLVSSFVPTPPLSVEQKVIVAELIPFDKNNEIDPTVYGMKAKASAGIEVRYRDAGGTIKVGLCCNGPAPVIKTLTEGSPSITRNKRSGYMSWFAVRFGSTWYELNVPANSVVDPPKAVPIEIFR